MLVNNISSMNADLTFDSVVYKKSYDDSTGSLRQSTARGINIPDKLSIKSQPYIDSDSKVAGTRYTGRVDLVNIDANLDVITTSMYFVVAVPSTAATADVTAIVAHFKAVVADSTFITAVLNNEK